MNTQHVPDSQISFTWFLYYNRRNRLMLCLAMITIILQFAVFKYLYPFANFIHNDSFTFLNAAEKNLTIDFYPIGYSKFLRLINLFAKPDFALVTAQYLFIQCGLLFLLFTIFYFYNPSKLTQWILLIFILGNPLYLHLANLVSNDGIFIALSSTWFALLLWIVQRPSMKVIFWHALMLLLVFTMSYNALIYPVIAALAFRLSSFSIRRKLAGIGLGLLFCALFVLLTMSQYKRITGYWQFSPFNGWQLANNALFAYRHVGNTDRKPVDPEYQALDQSIRNYYYQTRILTYTPTRKQWETTYYMWAPKLPLMQYRDSLFKNKEPKASEFKKWASMGPFYAAYGLHIIRKYPLHFSKYVLWPNVKNYFAPPVEVLENYNGGKRTVTSGTKAWFGYTKERIKIRMYDRNIFVLNLHPALSAATNIIMLFGLLYYLLLKGWQHNIAFNKALIMGSALWLLSAIYTICINSTALRLQSFPIIITVTFALLLVDWMMQLMRKMKLEQSKHIKLEAKFSNEGIA